MERLEETSQEKLVGSEKLSGLTAAFLKLMADNPEWYVQADIQRAVLTGLGYYRFTEELRNALAPILAQVKDDADIALMAQKHWDTLRGNELFTDGTCAFQLDDEERMQLFNFIQQNGFALDPWFQDSLRTSFTV